MKGGKDFIIQVIERITGITKAQMEDKTRKREVVVARQLAMYYFKLDDSIMTLKSIGQYFGNRDHSTVIHALKSVDANYATDRHYKKMVDDMCEEIAPKCAYLLGELSEDNEDAVKLRKNNLMKRKRSVTVDNKA